MIGNCAPSRNVYTARERRREMRDEIVVESCTVGAVIELDNAVALAQLYPSDRGRLEKWFTTYCRNVYDWQISRARYRPTRSNLRRLKTATENVLSYYRQFDRDMKDRPILYHEREDIAAAIELMHSAIQWRDPDPAPSPEPEPAPEPAPTEIPRPRRYRVVDEEIEPAPVRVLDWRPVTPPPTPRRRPKATPAPSRPQPHPAPDVLDQVRDLLGDAIDLQEIER